MVIPYCTAKLKSTNIFAMSVWDRTTNISGYMIYTCAYSFKQKGSDRVFIHYWSNHLFATIKILTYLKNKVKTIPGFDLFCKIQSQ